MEKAEKTTKRRPGRPKELTPAQRYYKKNRNYSIQYKRIKRKLETEKITELEFIQEIRKLKKKHNKLKNG